MNKSLTRIRGMILRYLYLHRRSVSRTLEIIFWPVMELFVWGFLTVYLRNISQGAVAQFIVYLIGAMIFWDLLYRAQQGVSISIVEEIWTQNIANLFVSPLRMWEWMTATLIYSFFKIVLIMMILSVIALSLYHFNFFGSVGFYLIPLAANLFIFGWLLGIATSGLLIRWGHAVEALIWGIPFLVQPFSAIFYPLSTLPFWIQKIALFLPSTYVFEGMRQVIQYGTLPSGFIVPSFLLNGVYFILSVLFFSWMLSRSRATGRLGRLGMD